MENKDYYIQLISARGDRYGGHGGVLDLLLWCSKNSLRDVTAEEARIFYEAPDSKYPPEESAASKE